MYKSLLKPLRCLLIAHNFLPPRLHKHSQRHLSIKRNPRPTCLHQANLQHSLSKRTFTSAPPDPTNPLQQLSASAQKPRTKSIDYSKYKPNTPSSSSSSSTQTSPTALASTKFTNPAQNTPPAAQSKLRRIITKASKYTLYTLLFLWTGSIGSYYLYQWYSPHPGYFSLYTLELMRTFRIYFSRTAPINTFNREETADNVYELEYHPESLTESVKSAQRWILKENFILQKSVHFMLVHSNNMIKWVDSYGLALETIFRYLCIQEINAQRQVLNDMISLYQNQLRAIDTRWNQLNTQSEAGVLSVLDPSYGDSTSNSLKSIYNHDQSSGFIPSGHHLRGDVFMTNPSISTQNTFPNLAPPTATALNPIQLPVSTLDLKTAISQPVHPRSHSEDGLDVEYLSEQSLRYLHPFLLALRVDIQSLALAELPTLIASNPPSQTILNFDIDFEQSRLNEAQLRQLTQNNPTMSLFTSTTRQQEQRRRETQQSGSESDLDQLELHELHRVKQHLQRLSPQQQKLYDEKVQALAMIQALSEQFDQTFQHRLQVRNFISELVQFDRTNPNSPDFGLGKGNMAQGDPQSPDTSATTTQTQKQDIRDLSTRLEAQSTEVGPDNLIQLFQLPVQFEKVLQEFLIENYPVQYAQDHDLELTAYFQHQQDEAEQLSNLQTELRNEMIASGELDPNRPSDSQFNARAAGFDALMHKDAKNPFDASYSDDSREGKEYRRLRSNVDMSFDKTRDSLGAVKHDSKLNQTTNYMNIPSYGDQVDGVSTLSFDDDHGRHESGIGRNEYGLVEDYGAYRYISPSAAQNITLETILSSNSSVNNAPFTFQFFPRHALTLYQLGYTLKIFREQLEEFSSTSQMLLAKTIATESYVNVNIGELSDVELQQDPEKRQQLESFFVRLNKDALDYSCARLNMYQLCQALRSDMESHAQYFHVSYPLPRIVEQLSQALEDETHTSGSTRSISSDSLLHMLQYQNPPPALTFSKSPERLFIFPTATRDFDGNLNHSSKNSAKQKYIRDMQTKIVDPGKNHSFTADELEQYYQYTNFPVLSQPISADLTQTMRDIIDFTNSRKTVQAFRSPQSQPLQVQQAAGSVKNAPNNGITAAQQRIVTEFEAKQMGIDLTTLTSRSPSSPTPTQPFGVFNIVDLSRDGQKRRAKGYVKPLQNDTEVLLKLHHQAASDNPNVFKFLSEGPSNVISDPIMDPDVQLHLAEIDEHEVFKNFNVKKNKFFDQGSYGSFSDNMGQDRSNPNANEELVSGVGHSKTPQPIRTEYSEAPGPHHLKIEFPLSEFTAGHNLKQ